MMMESNINPQIFEFEGCQVRFVGTADRPEWIADDVGKVLDIQNVRQNIAKFDFDEKGVCTIYTPGGLQELVTVTESGFYRLIFKSRKPIAERFKRWVFHEVLPSIRKTGAYSGVTLENTIHVESTSFDAILSSPPIIGNRLNPITKENITAEISNGYGWSRHEALLESQLVQLAAYRGMYIHRQSSHRSYALPSKTGSRRVDLILKSVEEEEDLLKVYELKSDYVDDYDVNETFLSKRYVEIVARDYAKRGIKVKKIVATLLSPGGITLSAVERLEELQWELSKTLGSIDIEIDSLLIHDFVCHEMYPIIKSRYEDEEGSFGTGFLKETIQPLCYRIIRPKLWLQKLINLQNLLAAKRKEELESRNEERIKYPLFMKKIPLTLLVDAVDEIERLT
jgi:prophage antirepressor-like protein